MRLLIIYVYIGNSASINIRFKGTMSLKNRLASSEEAPEICCVRCGTRVELADEGLEEESMGQREEDGGRW